MNVVMFETDVEQATATQSAVVSVCIANWNCREMLRGCLYSLLRQSQGVPLEVIVVDNASTDGAAAMVTREFPDVTLIRNTANAGFSVASNQAAAAAEGDYLLFLNNDTLVPANTLRQLVNCFEQNPTAGMIGPRLVSGNGRHQISYRRKPTFGALLHRIGLLRWTGVFRKAYTDYRRRDYVAHGTREVDVLMGAAVMLPRDVFDKSGRWDEAFRFGVEDIDLSTQVNRIAPVLYCGDASILHFGREASRANIRFSAPNVVVGYARYFRKCGAKPSTLIAYKTLITLDMPLQLIGKMFQGMMRSLRGQTLRAAKSRLSAKGIAHFLRNDLGRFWRA